jgi:hypothetical protein
MSGFLTGLGPLGTALSLLMLGHILADFTFQTDGIAENKHRSKTLLLHASIVLVLHFITFSPLLTVGTAFILAVVVIIHTIIDKFSASARNGDQDADEGQEDSDQDGGRGGRMTSGATLCYFSVIKQPISSCSALQGFSSRWTSPGLTR